MRVPFNKPVRLDDHLEFLEEAIGGSQLAGNGPIGERCEKLLEIACGAPARLTTSATHAMEMMALLTGIEKGDEVILPSFTFTSSANPFALRGAKLRFADNDEFGNILPSEIERLFSRSTKAVLVMHYAGGSADLDPILALCASRGVPLLEDAAQAVGATYRGRPLGAVGHLGCFSFHDTKNITAGEGGALLLRDKKYLDAADILREKGTNRRQFMQGLVDKYTWVAVGSSYILSELNAAYLYPQLERLAEINARRRRLCERYTRELSSAFMRLGVVTLKTPPYNAPNFHLHAVVFPKTAQRNAFIAAMKAEGVTCPFHYVPLHSSPYGRGFYEGGAPEDLPGCDRIAGGLVRLPLYYNMTDDEQAYVIDKALGWLKKA